MKKIIFLLSYLLLTIPSSTWGMWRVEEIQESIQRVRKVFYKNYTEGAVFLNQDQETLGQLMDDRNKIVCTFRGSRGYQELFSSMDTAAYPLKDIGVGLEGCGHRGYCLDFNRLDRIRTQVYHHVRSYEETSHISINDFSIILEGSSKGAAYATLLAADLKTKDEFSKCTFSIYTYAPAHIFDEPASKSYNNILKDNHLNVWAEEDAIARYADISSCPLGTFISFKAEELEGYRQRVQNRSYTNMMEGPKSVLNFNLAGYPIISKLCKLLEPVAPTHLLDPKVWEAHVDPTYEEWAQKKAPEYFKTPPF